MLLAPQSARAWSGWSDTDRALLVASNIALAADWASTRNAARQDWPGGLFEQNFILGRYPHQDKVDLYFIALIATNYLIADNLSTGKRKFYLSIRAITHAHAAHNNVQLGMEIKF